MREILEKYIEFVPESELKSRVEKLKKKLSADVALLFHPPDVYYFAGTKQDGFLVISKDKDPVFYALRHPERASAETVFEVIPLGSVKKLGELISEVFGSPKTIATELDVIPLSLFQRLKKLFPEAEFTDISSSVRGIKAVKSSWEIDVLKKCAEIVKKAYQAAVDHLKEGITELELAAIAFFEMRKMGHECGEVMRGGRMEGFLGYILSGEAAAVPSYANAPLNGVGLSPALPTGPSRKVIKKGEPVIFDFFGTYMGYLVDMTRTFALSPLPEKFRKMYEITKEMHAYLKENLKPGVNARKIFDDLVAMAEKTEFSEFFMGYGSAKVNFVGHGVGTEINEFPFIARGLDMELAEGMVVAVEPKFVVPGEGAVGLENTYLITEKGGVPITDAPEELIEK